MHRMLFSSCLFIALLAAPLAYAQLHDDPATVDGGRQSNLNQLFEDLKRESNEAAADRIVRRIREAWAESGGSTADLLVERAREAAAEDKFNVALDLLDQVVVLYPAYVEGWNSRALVYLMMNDYRRAMSDLANVLAVEPRHFEALNGMAGILRLTGHVEEALEVYRRMLDIYPMQRRVQRALISIMESQPEQRI